MFRLFDPGLGPLIAAVIADGHSDASVVDAIRRIGPAVEAVILVAKEKPEGASHPVAIALPERTARVAAATQWAVRVHGKIRGIVLIDPAFESHAWQAIEALKAKPSAMVAKGPDGLVLWPASISIGEFAT